VTARSKYIVFEGPDSCGKSEAMVEMKKRLSELAGVDCFKTPSYDGPVGRLIRQIFAGTAKVSPYAMMHLFNADAIDQEAFVKRRLSKGRHVILDRHTRISSCIYQVDFHPMSVVLGNLPVSLFKRVDLCVVLDASNETLSQRIKARENKLTDRMYTSADHSRLQTLRDRYAVSRHLHSDLVDKWLYLSTDDPENTPESIARLCCTVLGL